MAAPLVAALALTIIPASAQADSTPLGLTCSPQDGVRFCQGAKVKTFDGVPLDVDMALPASADSNLPVVVIMHGWGGKKTGFGEMKPWAQDGYAVLDYSARGFGDSCGSASSRAADPAGCARGWEIGRAHV